MRNQPNSEDYDIRSIGDGRSEGCTKDYLRFWLASLEYNSLPPRFEKDRRDIYLFFISLYEQIYTQLHGSVECILMHAVAGFGYMEPDEIFTIEYRPGKHQYLIFQFKDNVPNDILLDNDIWKHPETGEYVGYFEKITSNRPLPTEAMLALRGRGTKLQFYCEVDYADIIREYIDTDIELFTINANFDDRVQQVIDCYHQLRSNESLVFYLGENSIVRNSEKLQQIINQEDNVLSHPDWPHDFFDSNPDKIIVYFDLRLPSSSTLILSLMRKSVD